MLDTVRKIINCKLCHEVVTKPVMLPCGETICARHEKRFRNIYTAKCKLCEKQHRLTKNQQFPRCKTIQSFLDAEINKLDFGDEYKNSIELLFKIDELIKNYEKTKYSVEDVIYERFASMRRKVDLIREEIIQKVNKCSEKIIADIDSYEKECEANISTFSSKLESNKAFYVSKIKNDLNEWEKRLEKLFYDQELSKEINQKGKEYSESLKKGINDLKNEIFLGQTKKLEFETKYANIFDAFCEQIGFNT
jgi:hypothetical protein